MYKDKDKQRETDRERQRRDKKGVTVKGVTGIDKALICVRDEMKQEAEMIERVRDSGVLNISKRTERGNIRVFKPGDADYVPQCETTRAFIDGRPKRLSTAKAFYLQRRGWGGGRLLWASLRY